MHPLILYNCNDPAEQEKAEAAGADILIMCVELGGCLTGEHGVGIEKRDLMSRQYHARPNSRSKSGCARCSIPMRASIPEKCFRSRSARREPMRFLRPPTKGEAAEIVRAAQSFGGLDIVGARNARGFRPSPAMAARKISTTELSGIVFHEPAEMIVRARAGTPRGV